MPPPEPVPLTDRDRYLVRKARQLDDFARAGPFQVAGEDEVDIERYSDKYRSRFSRQALLRSWLPEDAQQYFPAELLVAAGANAGVSADEVERAARAARSTKRTQHVSSRALETWHRKEERREGDEEGGAEDDEVELEPDEEDEDFNDYQLNYYDESGVSDDDEDGGATF